MLKIKGIELRAKPLGRPPSLSIPVSPGERNPVPIANNLVSFSVETAKVIKKRLSLLIF
jgi:hypothetical protein